MSDEITQKDIVEILEILGEFGSWKYDGDIADLIFLHRSEGVESVKAAVEWIPTPKLF
ncbi:MAG: hypothetical protein AB8C02_00195 [Halioglobus sp.]